MTSHHEQFYIYLVFQRNVPTPYLSDPYNYDPEGTYLQANNRQYYLCISAYFATLKMGLGMMKIAKIMDFGLDGLVEIYL